MVKLLLFLSNHYYCGVILINETYVDRETIFKSQRGYHEEKLVYAILHDVKCWVLGSNLCFIMSMPIST